MNIIKSNIQNLTTLWSSICELHGTSISSSDFDFCFVEDAEWPKRIWFPSEIDSASLDLAISKAPSSTTITTWDVINGSNDSMLKERGFTLKTEQIGMSLSLTNYTKSDNDLILKKVDNADDAKLWEELFFSAFGYQIKSSLLLKKPDNLEAFIAYYNDQPAGTAMLFGYPDKIMGLHSMGIIKEMQRKGLGEKMLIQLLNLSKERGFDHVTLQASMAGLGLYEKIGFEKQFTMRNYIQTEVEK